MRVIIAITVLGLLAGCHGQATNTNSSSEAAAHQSAATAAANQTAAAGQADPPAGPPAGSPPNVPNEVQRHFDFEDVLSDTQQDYWVWRSEAGNQKVLRLEDQSRRHRIDFLLCIEPFRFGDNATLRVDDIRYANDGPSDVVFVTLDGAPFASFMTHEKWRSGHEWNVFRNSNELGMPVVLGRGVYTLQISVITDVYGVEFDKIRVNVENQDPARDLFCGASMSTV